MIIESLRGKIRTYQFIKLWRKINSHNSTVPGNTFDINTVNVGNYTYGTINVLKHSSTKEKLYIGHCCSIAPNVEFILGSDHPYCYLSTFPFKVKVFDEQSEAISKGDIRVGDDVWIGYGSIILSGVKINQGAIIAAGSVVTKDVPPYAIVGGNPAKIIKYRFDDNIIKQLIKFDFSNINDKLIRQHLKDLYMPIEDNNNLQFIMK